MGDSLIKQKWKVGMNYQTDNLEPQIKGKVGVFKNSWQCFDTCAWMLLSWISPDIYKHDDDKGLLKYLDDVEASVGEPGIAEKLSNKKSGTSYFFYIQKAAIQAWADNAGIIGEAVFEEKKIKFDDLPELISNNSPVILGTHGLGGTRGHIILAVGSSDDHIIINDPYGDARDNYTDEFGDGVFYEKKWLKKFTGKYVNCIYWKS